MKKLIYLTGDIDSPFLTNEIDAFVKSYDQVLVVGYAGDKNVCDRISKQYGFKYALIEDVKNKREIISDFLKWKKRRYVKEELSKFGVLGSLRKKRKLYVYYYGLYWVKLNRIVRKFIDDDDDCYVYSFWLSRPAFGSANIRKTFPKVKRAVSRTHRYDLYEEENSYGYLPFRKFISESIDTIYFSSLDTVSYFYGKKYSEKKLPNCKLSYLGTFDHGQKEVDENKKEITIASCSYIIQRKRLDLIIALIKEISKYNGYVKWIHIGDGDLSKTIQETAKNELKDIEYSFLGTKSDEEIFDIYRTYDVDFFANMSDSEGIPVSIMEAMSMGIPIIARNVGGISDAVNDLNGVLLEGNNDLNTKINDAAKRIVELFSNKNEYRNMCCNSFEKWNDRFNSKNNAIKVALDMIDNTVIPYYEHE